MVSLIWIVVNGRLGYKYRFVLSRHMMRGDEKSFNQHGIGCGCTENEGLCYSGM